MKWISVKDCLPELEQKVLISDGKDASMACRWKGFADKIYWISAGCFSHEGCDLDVSVESISHWMPIPELPK